MLKTRFALLFVVICYFNGALLAQTNDKVEPVPEFVKKINWVSIEEAQELMKKQPKKVLIDMYTDWCGWCKKMDKEAFDNPNIAAYISQNFYAVKFDAETIDSIEFKGTTYTNQYATGPDATKGRGKTHSLAVELLNSSMSYPTIVYLDENFNNLSPVPGFKSAKDLEPFLIYFAENVYINVPWDEYYRDFNKTFWEPDENAKELVKWYSLQEALDLNAKNPKKILVDLYTDFSTLNKVMLKTTYNNPVIADYLNTNYYPVRFDALSKDTITVFNQTFTNPGIDHPYHMFAVTVLQGKMRFPNVLFMDGNNMMITPVPEYRSPEKLEPILSFFGENFYLTVKFNEYLESFKSKIEKPAPPPVEPK